MTEAIRAECAAWWRYADYCTKMSGNGHHEFRGDETSHGLFRQWRALRDVRDAISQPHHKQNRMHAGTFSTRGAA